MYNTIPHAEIPLPKAAVHIKHPLRNKDSHQALLDYIQPRLTQGRQGRDARIDRLASIDKCVAGWMRMTEDDRARARKQELDGIPQALTMNLPLTFVQLDDMMTYYAATFSPNRGMFYQQGKPDEKDAAGQIVTLMNNHAIYAGYYRQTLLSIFAILKYNLGGLKSYWSSDMGPRLAGGGTTQTVLTNEIIWSGNKVESLDMYNTMWDESVHPTQLYKDGEWCASSWLVSHYWLQKRCADELYFNCEEALAQDTGLGNCVYYRSPPAEARVEQDTSQSGATNWVGILSETPGYAMNTGYEVTEMFIKLNPVQMNLVPKTAQNKNRNRYEIWRISLLNDKWIIDATYMTNVHGYLPFFMGVINDGQLGTGQKSPAEILKPLQDFASFLLNTHVRATRKNIWGLTVYDKSVVDLGSIPAGEVAAMIPAKPEGNGKKISDAIWSHSGTLDTKQTMQDFESVIAVIEKFFPTQSAPSQIGNIDRAIDSQVAAVQQGANRRMQKGARLLDDSMFRPLRFSLYYNIIQYQQDGVSVSDFYGRPVTIDLAKLRETDLPFIIGQGLKAIDRQAAASQMQNIIFALIQNPATAQRVDLMAMIDYWTSMIDIDIDMKQFELQLPPQQQTPGIGDNGGPPLDDVGAGGPPIQGIVDPNAVTQPLKG